MSVRIPFAPGSLERRTVAQMAGGWGRGLRVKTGHTGQWKCELDTFSPLCIKALFENCRARNTLPYIPGSSLRGMFRNMVQVIGAGCALDYPVAHQRPDLEPCTLSGGLCLACRLFGTVGNAADSGAWMGKVRVRDTARVNLPNGWESVSVDGPRDFGTDDDTDGWVLFSSEKLTWRAQRGGLVCVPAGLMFPFSVEFDNLDDEEAAVLQFATTLQHGDDLKLLHKLGFGKALGLGTVAIGFDASETGAVDEGPMDRYSRGAIWKLLREHRAQ